jgi:hypothetical protein
VFLELFRVPIEGIFLVPLSLVASVFVPNKCFEYWFLTIQETNIIEILTKKYEKRQSVVKRSCLQTTVIKVMTGYIET